MKKEIRSQILRWCVLMSMMFGIGVSAWADSGELSSVTASKLQNGKITFTITRSGSSEEPMVINYRTLNGTALGDVHFDYVSGSAIIEGGEKSTTVSVDILTAKSVDRWTNVTAKRTFALNVWNESSNKSCWTSIPTREVDLETTDYNEVLGEKFRFESGSSGDVYNNFKLTCHKDSCFKNLSDYYDDINQQFFYGLSFRFLFREIEDAYYRFAVSDKGSYNDYTGINGNTYHAKFETNPNCGDIWFEFPAEKCYDTDMNTTTCGVFHMTEGNEDNKSVTDYIKFKGDGLTGQPTIYNTWGASGDGKNIGEVSSLKYKFNPIAEDSEDPSLVGVFCNTKTIYRYGDSLTIALKFNEIIKNYSCPVMFSNCYLLTTNVGDFNYVGGKGTNVLYFKGVIKSDVDVDSLTSGWSAFPYDYAGRYYAGGYKYVEIPTLKGFKYYYSRATNVNAIPDAKEKKITLSWINTLANGTTSGYWNIWRYDNVSKEYTWLGRQSIENRSYVYTSDNLVRTRSYTFYVVYSPDDKTKDSPSVNDGHVTTMLDFHVNIDGVDLTGSWPKVSWSIDAFDDNDEHKLYIYRNDQDNPLEEVRVTKSKTKGNFEDKTIPNSCAEYKYYAEVSVNSMTYESSVEGGYMETKSSLNSVSASTNLDGKVQVKWDVTKIGTEKLNYEIWRKETGTDYDKMATVSDCDSYMDETIKKGVKYKYKVKTTLCGKDVYKESGEGYSETIATISGTVTYKGGTPVKNVTITVVSDDNTIGFSDTTITTDEKGRYSIRVPYAWEGSYYDISASFPGHKIKIDDGNEENESFSTTQRVSHETESNLSQINFKDLTSVRLSGSVFYWNTNYPVDSVDIYVDGNPYLDANNMPFMTAKDGTFNIEIANGKHQIEVRKNGHVFADKGLYPLFGTKDFTKDVSNLEFVDSTFVTLTGRVAGGWKEKNKCHGLGEGLANMGQAIIKLTVSEQLNKDKDKIRTFSPSSEYVKSTASTGKCDNDSEAKIITIKTDPKTGEFAVALPPIEFTIDEVSINTSNYDLRDINKRSVVNLSSNRLQVITDTLVKDGDTITFDYLYALDFIHTEKPIVKVTPKSNNMGAFGDSIYEYKDPATGSIEEIKLWKRENNSLKYEFGFPVFTQMEKYSHEIYAYEEYVNYDKEDAPLIDRVPLVGAKISIENDLGALAVCNVESKKDSSYKDGDVYETDSEDLELDSLGKVNYTFVATFPNIVSPYLRHMNIICTYNGEKYNWNPEGKEFEGYVLGGLSSGKNFVTGGPVSVSCVLRDPPGTGSYAYLEEGTTITKTESRSHTASSENSLLTTVKVGGDNYFATGIGVATITWVKASLDASLGTEDNYSFVDKTTSVHSITTTSKISTSAEQSYVGEDGDVFIGTGSNFIYGKERLVCIDKCIDTEKDSSYFAIKKKDAIGIGQEYTTAFKFTQNYIENVLIPNYEIARNSVFTHVKKDEYNKTYENTSGKPLYITNLSEDDERLGSSNTDTTIWGDEASKDESNGPSYIMIPPVMIAPDTFNIYSDTILWFNEQINTWKYELEKNERQKVEAIEHGTLLDSITFDSGVQIENSVQTCNSKDKTTTNHVKTSIIISTKEELSVNNTGAGFDFETKEGYEYEDESGDQTETCITVGYVLAEVGDDDAISMSVYDGGDGSGPIFYTRAGQTSCPYEGEKRTRYYEPGKHILSEATAKIEDPQISVKKATAINVSSGTAANFTLELGNRSETDEDVTFILYVVDATNPNGASLRIENAPLTTGRPIRVDAGETIYKELQLMQTRTDILNYDSIAVVLASQCQYDGTDIWDVIADTVYLSASFVPSCSPVELTIDKTILNLESDGILQMVVSGYNPDFLNFKRIEISYKGENDNEWINSEKTLYQTDLAASNTSPSRSISIPMTGMSFSDQVYQVRATSVCEMGTNTVITKSSEIINVVRDMSRPVVLGNPNPSDGILDAGDEISVTFNENIRNGLSKQDNFVVQAVLNDAKVDHSVALKMDGSTTFTATTESSIPLDNKSFSFDMWVNLSSGGTLLAHNPNGDSLVVSISNNGNLIIDIDGKKIISSESIPFDTWCFLAISYSLDKDSATINAVYVTPGTEQQLFNNVSVEKYDGNGRLYIGKNLIGAISELTLWNMDRTNKEAVSQMYNVKTASSMNLIGYWRFDEGHGLEAADKARNRNMILSTEGWYMDNVNIASHFDGANCLPIDISSSTASSSDDYMTELWFRGNSQSNATLWSADTVISLMFNSKGYLTLLINNEENQLSSENYLDGAWHHVALNVLRNGMTSVYVDGELIKQIASSKVPELSAKTLTLGAQRYFDNTKSAFVYNNYFSGDIDEVRYWLATLNASTINQYRFIRMSGNEAGLRAYCPFEETITDHGQTEMIHSLKEMINNVVYKNDEITASASAPSLREKPIMSDIAFNFVSSDRTINIELTEKPSLLEGTMVYVTLKNVRDLNDNYSSPITWSAYINQNRLVWSDEEIAIEKDDETSSSFEVSVVNQGAVTESWSISGLPSWLSANKTSGSLAAKKNEKISFEISDATPVGTYEESIYLTGNDEISVPLSLIIKVTANKPNWIVDPSQYKNSMSVLAQLKVDGKYSSDEDDMVAAFINGVCVGVASPVYYPRYDAYFVSLGIYGNDAEVNKNITFKAWDASTGVTYPSLSTSTPISFEANKVFGSMTKPILFETKDLQEQMFDLRKGWNWISLNVKPENESVNEVFNSVADETNLLKSKLQVAYSDEDSLVGTLETAEVGVMYKINMDKDAVLNLIGSPIDPAKDSVSVKTGWNWIGFNSVSNMSLGAAFADLDPVDGDLVKSQTDFAIYQDYEWVGTLTSLNPGKGYMYKSASNKDRSFTYPAKVASLKMAPMKAAPKKTLYTPVDETVYSGNMTIAAVVKKNGEIIPNAQVGVFDANGVCRGAGATGYKSTVFLVVLGESSKDALTFKVMVNGFEYTVDQTLSFEEDANYGTLQDPYVIDLGSGEITKLDFENDNLTSVSVCPTFVETELNVKSQTAEIENYTINDITGKLIMNVDVNSSDFTINVSDLSQGVYLINLKTSMGIVVKQFTKK